MASWFFSDERDDYSLAVAREVESNGAVVPALWLWEVENILYQGLRRRRISETQLLSNLGDLRTLGFDLDLPPSFGAELTLAKRHSLTIYDAAYLELALRRNLRLATKDTALTRAAKAESLYYAMRGPRP
ncbi:MAG: type II toxin-antitoxin system VapC family toxin [Candidatus Eremiobacteraeota bacterium]|nr:type II toxin-antitoxin system VapC family toxin [Candidatus Eremiobacteraeota bacterium]MBV9056408.1 type II toxin-antitoxin system VapC family toxin [Candidatus Eremiobacteraeota bacterium]MBV9700795.1 type II toxin-antitoxin system VapC family toxin [Candidatus Eremiobacteraeota bacterium]